MSGQLGDAVVAERLSMSPRDTARDYRRLLGTLTSRARWLGSRDPEGAAQEALRRSLENANSQPAVHYYFSENLAPGLNPPEWPLDQLFAWLHGVLYYVVREERDRVSNQREVPMPEIGTVSLDQHHQLDPTDPAPDVLDTLIQNELRRIVVACFLTLDRESRTVLRMRVDGVKYAEIAIHLGVNENTVATWISRGIRALSHCVRRRTQGFAGLSRTGRSAT